MKSKRLMIISLFILLTLILLFYYFKIKHDTQAKEIKNNVSIIDFRIPERFCTKVDNTILVGENEKEIENGFFDIKIINNNKQVEIYLNKLWYKNYGTDYIQDDYLANICRKIASNLNVDTNNDELEYTLYKYIKENYIKSRQNQTIEKICLENMTILLTLEDNMSKLIIQGGS